MRAAAVIRSARLRNGLTQGDLARRAGTSQPVISAYEHGRRDPSLTTLSRLVAATGERLRVTSAPPRSDLPPPASLEEHGARLLEVLSLVDAVPTRRRGPLNFPRIDST